ncbi:MAG TPA: efflux RND transporter periplasmic adaptor subunit [Sedimentisphaerales bacterium]|nr:efflux RND transporter periplasmic adaptor subunit [Sedimentisphaerales bacterium]
MLKNNAKNNRSRLKSPKVIGAIVAVVLICLIIVLLKVVRSGENPTSGLATFVAKRGPLTISVLESGTIQPQEQITLRNEVEGRTSILSLVSDGTMVKAGDLLVELDDSTLKDSMIDQDIQVQRAEAAYINAQETLAVVKNQAQSDVEVSKLTQEFAQQDLQQYKEGLYPNEKTAAENEITLRQEELTRAEETLTWSQKLYEEKYISQTEWQADKLAVTRSNNNLVLAENSKKLLENFTYHRNIAQLESDVHQAKMALERTERKAKADVIQVEADLKAKELEYRRQAEKLTKIVDQLEKTKIYAPMDGMVVYATSSGGHGPFDRREPMEIGVEVTERQDLINLPTATLMKAQVNIHETSLEKVRVGLPAVITVDALPGKKFLGHVGSIAPLPDARSMWMNPDLKIYPMDIFMEDNDSALRTGMSCKAEIIVEQYANVVYVPVQAVLRVGGQPTVYVVKDGSYEGRKVEIGLDDNRMIRILSGLEEREVVLLTPPLKAATLESGSQVKVSESLSSTDTSDTLKQRINEKLKETNGTGFGMPSDNIGGPPQQEQERPMGPGRGEFGREQTSGESSQIPSSEQMENMSPEEREKIRQRFQGTGTGQGAGQRQGESQRPRGPERNQ